MTIVDVRSQMEYRSGHVAGSINIPVTDMSTRLDELRSLEMPLIVCCASGTRSEQATLYLNAQGIVCENGGSWLEISKRYKNTR